MTSYGCLMIDPPHRFTSYGGKDLVPTSGKIQPYKTMTTDEICAIPVGDFLANDAAVFVWTNDSLPPSTIERYAEAWGLHFFTSNVFIWDKMMMGMGYATRKECETVALLTRGSPKRKSKGVRQLIREKRRRPNSRKPEKIYKAIMSLYDGPYLEMFARRRYPGWDAMGNETDALDGGLMRILERPTVPVEMPPVTGPLLELMLAQEPLPAAAE